MASTHMTVIGPTSFAMAKVERAYPATYSRLGRHSEFNLR